MAKDRAFIIHGYQGYPDEAWQPWLKAELEIRGYVAALPAMPHPDRPGVEEWIGFITRLVGVPDERTVLVGHSMGGLAVLRYLETLGVAGKSVRRTVLIATHFIAGLSRPEAERRADGDSILVPWFTAALDAGLVKAAAGECTVILSDDDPYIPLEEARTAFREKLGAEIIVEKGQGHFNEDTGIKRLPSALAAALS